MKRIYALMIALIIILGAIFIPTYIFRPQFIKNIQEIPLRISQNRTKNLGLQENERSFIEKIGLTERTFELSAFSGLPLARNTVESPIAVIIENHGLAQPHQKGLSLAPIVYETYAEGGITRFMAIFASTSPERIGPIRSLRPYFLEWAKEHAHTVVHAGGSEEALANLTVSGLFDIDEEEEASNILIRDKNVEKPHNLFADMDTIRSSLPSPIHRWEAMPFIFAERKDSGDMSTIKIAFGEPYNASFVYDKEKNTYVRHQRGEIHKDHLNNKPLTPANIIVQEARITVLDDIGRLEIQTKGSGKILVFSSGSLQKGTWEKKESVTKYFNEEKEPVTLQKGQTWIIVIDSLSKISWE